MTSNDDRPQIRATGATSAHVGMTEAEQERARVVAWANNEMLERRRAAWAEGGCLFTRLQYEIESRIYGELACSIARGDHLKGVE